MVKAGRLNERGHKWYAPVPLPVLKSIVGHNYNTSLTEQEISVLAAARVPPDLKPWFEEVVIGEFYVMMRHLVRHHARPTQQAGNSDLAFLELLVAELLPRPEPKNIRTIWESYASRQNFSISARLRISREQTFEDVVTRLMRQYIVEVTTSVKMQLDNEVPFSYKPANRVMKYLRENALR